MIESIKLTRFKQFRETEIALAPFCILTGENNSGKTTVLQAIWLALHSLYQGKLVTVDRRTLQARISGTGYYMFDVPFVPQDDLNSLFYNKIARGSATYDENSGALVELVDGQGNHLRLHMRELFKNLNVKLLTPAAELHCPTLQNYAPLYISGYAGIRFREERMYPAILEAHAASGEITSSVRNLVLDLKLRAPEKFEYLCRIMREEFGFAIGEVHFHENSERYVFTEYEQTLQQETVGLEFGSCGSGTLQVLQILSGILRYCPERTRVVLIDEPEAHLDGALQVRFLRVLQELRDRLEIQMILATHSERIVQSADPGEVVPVIAQAKQNHALQRADAQEDRKRGPRYEQLSFTDL